MSAEGQDTDRVLLEEDDVAEQRRGLVVKAALCFKLATIHALSNDAMRAPTRDLATVIAALFDLEGGVALEVSGANFFLNDEPVRLDSSSLESAQILANLFERLEVSKLEVSEPVAQDEVLSFLQTFQDAYAGRAPLPGPGSGERITLTQVDKDSNLDLPRLEPRQYVLRSYAALIAALHEELAALDEGRRARLVRVRRLVQILCDATEGHDTLLIALGRLQQTAGIPAYHLAATASLVLVMARRLGVGRRALVDLVMQALFHDVGHVKLPPPVDEDELNAALERSPVDSVLMASASGVSVGALGRLAVCWDHRKPIEGDPFGPARLIAVASAFDTMTGRHPPGLGLPPEQAVRILLNQAGGRFEEWAAKLLVNVIGLYPIGTTVRLTNGEIGIVIRTSDQPEDFARPTVRLVDLMSGEVKGELDLSRTDDVDIKASASPVSLDAVLDQFMRV